MSKANLTWKGVPEDLWPGIPSTNQRERTGYPTQKPLALYRTHHRSQQQRRRHRARPLLRLRHHAGRRRATQAAVGRHGHLGRRQGHRAAAPAGRMALHARRSRTSSRCSRTSSTSRRSRPQRTDDNEIAAPTLRLRIQRPVEPWQKISHSGMMNVLAAAQGSGGGVICAGCGRVLEREFMQLDHINRRSPTAARTTSSTASCFAAPATAASATT